MIRYLKRTHNVLREAWLAPRAKKNETIFSRIYKAYLNYECNHGIEKYLNEQSNNSIISPLNEWDYCDELDEYHHYYESTYFANGQIRLKNINKKKLIIFLSGYYSNSDDVFINKSHPQYLVKKCKDENISLASWSTINQGSRAQNAIYKNLNSVVSVEREYSRFLPLLGTSIWNEYVHELSYCIKMISNFYNNDIEICTVGWSMGGAFAHLAPLLCDTCKMTISAGSLARYSDLLLEGNTRLQGYFFYPFNNRYFDLENIIRESINHGATTIFLYGENDPGCLKSTRIYLKKEFKKEANFLIKEFKNDGHFFLPNIKNEIFNQINNHSVK